MKFGGSRLVHWAALDSGGATGGILLLWNSRKVPVTDWWSGSYVISAKVEDLFLRREWLISAGYGPNDHNLSRMIERWRLLVG